MKVGKSIKWCTDYFICRELEMIGTFLSTGSTGETLFSKIVIISFKAAKQECGIETTVFLDFCL